MWACPQLNTENGKVSKVKADAQRPRFNINKHGKSQPKKNLTWATELGEKDPLPRGQVVGGQRTVPVSLDVGSGDQEAIPGAVDDESQRSISSQVNVFDHGHFLQNFVIFVLGHGNLADAAAQERDEEATVQIVPLGALSEPAGAVVVVHVGGGFGQLQGY